MSDSEAVCNPEQMPDALRKAELDQLTPALYGELQSLARTYLARERPGHTLQPTALVHEAYLRLAAQYKVNWSSKAQVLGLAATMMRRVLVTYAQARSAQKREGGVKVPLEIAIDSLEGTNLDLQKVDFVLTRLGEVDPRQERIVELRFFSGLTIEETAEALNLSPATVKREWRTARLWMLRELDGVVG